MTLHPALARHLATALVVACGCAAGPAVAAESAAATAPPATQAAPAATDKPAAAPVFLNIVPEGGHIPTPAQAAAHKRQLQEEQATTESVLAAAAGLRRVGLFAVQFMAALLVAGIFGGCIAGLVMLIKSRRRAADPT